MGDPVSRVPFYKPDPRGWPAIAELLPKPWPEEAIAHDLVWWADQVAIGRVPKMPGAVTLAARWGLSRHSRRVRLALGYIVAPEGPVCCTGSDASMARGWRAAGASVAHFLDDIDDCTSPAGASLAHDWRVPGASVARDSDGQIDEESANDAAPDAAPRARGTEPRAQIPDPIHEEQHHAHAPAHEATDTLEVDGRAGVDAGPVPEQTPPRRPLPIRPLPIRPVLPLPIPPAAPSSAEVAPPLPLVLTAPEQASASPWQLFAALAVEHGLVKSTPRGTAGTYKGSQTREQALGALAKSEGLDRVLAVWAWVLTSPGRGASWWRANRVGPELVGTFLVKANYAKIADGYDAERENGIRFPPRQKGEVLRLPTMDAKEVKYWQDEWDRVMANTTPREEDDAIGSY